MCRYVHLQIPSFSHSQVIRNDRESKMGKMVFFRLLFESQRKKKLDLFFPFVSHIQMESKTMWECILVFHWYNLLKRKGFSLQFPQGFLFSLVLLQFDFMSVHQARRKWDIYGWVLKYYCSSSYLNSWTTITQSVYEDIEIGRILKFLMPSLLNFSLSISNHRESPKGKINS